MTNFICGIIYEIEEHFVELWNDEFEFNENEWDEYTLDLWIDDLFGCYFSANWTLIYDSIYENFTIQETFEMLNYLDENGIDYDIEDLTGTIEKFIICVCVEYRRETDYMQYDYYVDASNKIKQWWKKIYWSPKTKVGIKRFNRECDKLGY